MTHRLTLKKKATRQATIEDMQQLAKKHGGKCLSKKYITARLKLTWKCKKGHTWDATVQSIKHRKSWCPKCAGVTDSKWKAFIVATMKKSRKPIKIMDICNMAVKHYKVKSDLDKMRAYRNILKYTSNMILYDELKVVKKIGRYIYVSKP